MHSLGPGVIFHDPRYITHPKNAHDGPRVKSLVFLFGVKNRCLVLV